MILFRIMPDGAFVVGDSESRATVYSYPTSQNAERAARAKGNSQKLAALASEIIAHALKGPRGSKAIRDEYDRLNWQRLDAPDERKTPGQLAYEADLEAAPTYDDGTSRKPWAELGDVERWSWERNPTPRAKVSQ